MECLQESTHSAGGTDPERNVRLVAPPFAFARPARAPWQSEAEVEGALGPVEIADGGGRAGESLIEIEGNVRACVWPAWEMSLGVVRLTSSYWNNAGS